MVELFIRTNDENVKLYYIIKNIKLRKNNTSILNCYSFNKDEMILTNTDFYCTDNFFISCNENIIPVMKNQWVTNISFPAKSNRMNKISLNSMYTFLNLLYFVMLFNLFLSIILVFIQNTYIRLFIFLCIISSLFYIKYKINEIITLPKGMNEIKIILKEKKLNNIKIDF